MLDNVPDPRHQRDWRMDDLFVAEGLPHRSCISLAEVQDVQGLVRSEMMTVTGMMVSAMREDQTDEITAMPVSPGLSVIH